MSKKDKPDLPKRETSNSNAVHHAQRVRLRLLDGGNPGGLHSVPKTPRPNLIIVEDKK